MEKITERIKQVLRFYWHRKYRVICCGIAVFALFSGIHAAKGSRYGSAALSLNYSEASLGLNPNNTRFSAYELLSDEVLDRAIHLVGLQDSLSPETLAGCINITPVDTGNAGGDGSYISTTYEVALDASALKLEKNSVSALLENVCTAYKAYFLENHCDNQSILKIKLEETTDCEPYIRLNEIELRVRQLNKYLNTRLSENKNFADSETGISFSEIDKRLQNIISYDIPNAKAYVVERGVAKDTSTLTQILAYKNTIEGLSVDKNMAYYAADNAGIALYEKSMSSVVMIPTIDEYEQYYMSRTKSAMDKMAKSADESLNEATGYRKNITETAYVIDRMSLGQTTEKALFTAQSMINKLETALNDISDDLYSLDLAYLDYKSRNYITFNYYTPSFSQRIAPKKTLAETALVFLCSAFFVYRGIRKKERKEKLFDREKI